MKKIFMDRAVMPHDTVQLQKEYINNVLKLDYDLDIWNTPDEEFWVSKIQLKDFEPFSNLFSSTRGKGMSKDECLASNYGEFFERFLWDTWKSNALKKYKNKVRLKNLTTGDYDYLDVDNILDLFQDAEYLAAGNNIEEARYHALADILENGSFLIHFPINQLETTIARTEKLFPNIPKKYNDNYHMFVQRDPRIPSLYMATVFKKPNLENDYFREDLTYVKDDKIFFHGFHQEKPNMAYDPWPALAGRRIGLNVEKLFHSSIAESIQLFHALKERNPNLEFVLKEGEYKKYPSNWVISEEYKNNEKETIEEDNQIIIDEMAEAGFNLWEIDLTLPESPMSAVKIISDYSLSGENPFSRKFLSRMFYF